MYLLPFFLKFSLKGQEQVVCKFYNELGQILVKDFPSVPQLDEIPRQAEDSDFPAYPQHHETGKRDIILIYNFKKFPHNTLSLRL